MTCDLDPDRRRDDRLLARLAEGEATVEGADRRRLRIVGARSVRRLAVDPDRLAALIAEGLVVERGAGEAAGEPRLALSALGRARLARQGDGADDFRRQHGDVAEVTVDGGAALRIERAESPLARLARARGGRAWVTPARLEAGERLRGDFTRAAMMPSVTSNWSIGGRGGRGPGGAAGGIADLTDRAVAARLRVEAALGAVGGDLGGLLIDVCCFLKGLETVESERRWPPRSAKVVLDIALGRLAEHYGLADEARGRDGPGRARAWATVDGRPGAAAR